MDHRRYPVAVDASDRTLPIKPSVYPEPFLSRVAGRVKRALGDLFGLTNFGVNITRLAPGGVSALRHARTRQDEFVYILEGEPTLITGAGETPLRRGFCVGFKSGSGNAHQLVNRGSTDVLFLDVGDRSASDTVDFPDDDIQALLDSNGKWTFSHKDGTPY